MCKLGSGVRDGRALASHYLVSELVVQVPPLGKVIVSDEVTRRALRPQLVL